MKRAWTLALLAVISLCLSQPAAAQDSRAPKDAKPVAVRQALTTKLVDLGYTPSEAQQRVNQLNDQEIGQLMANPDQVGVGGIQDKTLIIIAVILVLPSILLLMAL